MLQLPDSEVIRHFNTKGRQALLTPSPQEKWFHVSIYRETCAVRNHFHHIKTQKCNSYYILQIKGTVTKYNQSFTSTRIYYLKHVKTQRYHNIILAEMIQLSIKQIYEIFNSLAY